MAWYWIVAIVAVSMVVGAVVDRFLSGLVMDDEIKRMAR